MKNALAAQGDRSVFQKLREAALAYHLERKWTKQKILTQYLNSVYFGNGAYGVEAAVRTYFGGDDEDDRRRRRRASTADPAARSDDDRDAEAASDVTPGRGGAARRDHRLAERVRPGPEPAGAPSERRNLVLAADARAGA